jgi:uncharacterized membrane protein YgaE (UPF0421/DUF939 family)
MNIPYYYNRIKSDAIILKEGYFWNNRESQFAVKAAIASILSMLLAYSLNLEEAYWASISSIIVMLPTAGATAKKALFRFCGTVIGALSAVFMYGLFVQNHIFFSIVIFLFITFGIYKSIFSEYSYFWFLLIVTAAIIMIGTIAKNSPEKIVDIAFNRCFEVSIGIGVTSFLSLLVWPQYAAHEYYKKSIILSRAYLLFFEFIFKQYLDGEYEFEKTKKKFYDIKKKIFEIKDLLGHAQFEIKTARRQKSLNILDTDRLTLNINHIWDFYLSVKKFDDLKFHKSYCQYIRELIFISRKLLNFKSHFKQKAKIIELSDCYLEQIHKRYLRKKMEGVNLKHELKDVFLFQEFLLLLREFVDFSRNRMLYNNDVYTPAGNTSISYFPEEIYTFDFFGHQKLINIPILKYSMKVGFTVVAVIWLWQLFEIPTVVSNMAVAILLVLQPDIMTTYLKGLLRFLGCLCGVSVGFLFLGLQIQSTSLLCVSLFFVVYISMYIYIKGGPAISYLGLQMAFAFFIAVLPEPHATIDTTLFVNRLIGIFFGVGVAWLINISFFSKDLLSTFREQIFYLKNKISSSSEQLRSLCSDSVSPDISSFYSSLNVLTDQKEITLESSFYFNKYLKNVEKFFRVRYLLLITDKSTVEFINGINSNIRNNVVTLVEGISDKKKNQKDACSLISITIKYIDKARAKIRTECLVEERTIEFRQQYCQYMINLKRMLLVLSELYTIEERLINENKMD